MNQLKELLEQIKKLQDECNNGNLDAYNFYEEVVMLVEYYENQIKK
jgi:hypothetical protein